MNTDTSIGMLDGSVKWWAHSTGFVGALNCSCPLVTIVSSVVLVAVTDMHGSVVMTSGGIPPIGHGVYPPLVIPVGHHDDPSGWREERDCGGRSAGVLRP